MTRWLVRFGYDGRGFAGWARQPGLRTVEGEIRKGIARRKIAADVPSPSLRAASRTDRGVSARGNALALHSELPGPALLRALNGLAPEIFFTHARFISEEFSPRAALERWYRYFETGVGPSQAAAWRRVAKQFERDVDVRSFGRGIRSPTPVWRPIHSATVDSDGSGLVLDFRAPSFAWGMVRKMVAALRQVDRGELTPDALREAIDGRRLLTLPLADAESLVLWEVHYEEPWTFEHGSPTRRQRGYFAQERARLEVRSRILEAIDLTVNFRNRVRVEPADVDLTHGARRLSAVGPSTGVCDRARPPRGAAK